MTDWYEELKKERSRNIRARKRPKKQPIVIAGTDKDRRKDAEYLKERGRKYSEYCSNPKTRPLYLEKHKNHPWRLSNKYYASL